MGGPLKQKAFERKMNDIKESKMNAVSLIIIQLLIFITYTVKIVSESFETELSFTLSNNDLLDYVMLLLILSIVILVFVLVPVRSNVDINDEKQLKQFNMFYKIHHLLYIIGYYLMVFGVYFVVVIILFGVGFNTLFLQISFIVLLSILVFMLIKSITDIVFK